MDSWTFVAPLVPMLCVLGILIFASALVDLCWTGKVKPEGEYGAVERKNPLHGIRFYQLIAVLATLVSGAVVASGYEGSPSRGVVLAIWPAMVVGLVALIFGLIKERVARRINEDGRILVGAISLSLIALASVSFVMCKTGASMKQAWLVMQAASVAPLHESETHSIFAYSGGKLIADKGDGIMIVCARDMTGNYHASIPSHGEGSVADIWLERNIPNFCDERLTGASLEIAHVK